jgi:hypothetical protein
MASHSGNSDDRLSKGIAVSGLERYFDNSLFLPCDWPPALLLLVSSGVVVPALCLSATVPVAPSIYEPFIHLSFRLRRTNPLRALWRGSCTCVSPASCQFSVCPLRDCAGTSKLQTALHLNLLLTSPFANSFLPVTRPVIP